MIKKMFKLPEKIISISYGNNVIIVNINDFINPIELSNNTFFNRKINIKKMISNNILWNNDLQMINKGTYYIFENNDSLYNILIKENIIEIDERKKTNDEKEEKILTINTNNNNYKYCSYKCDNFGKISSKYYSNTNIATIALETNEQEAKEEIKVFINDLKKFLNINDILDMELIESAIINRKKQL